MGLTAGHRIGPYEVLSPLGAGGICEVYRARDTRLARDVAIKVLHEALATDPDRLARFQREAQLLASLNHPNIAIIHGLEDGPAAAGPHARALVMELVEGPTLADRIAQGPIPLDEALPIARQIAEALEAAHELFFVAPTGALMSARVERGSPLRIGTPTKVLDGPYVWALPAFAGRLYDASPDGQRFLLLKESASPDEVDAPTSVTVVQNWTEELKRLVPAN